MTPQTITSTSMRPIGWSSSNSTLPDPQRARRSGRRSAPSSRKARTASTADSRHTSRCRTPAPPKLPRSARRAARPEPGDRQPRGDRLRQRARTPTTADFQVTRAATMRSSRPASRLTGYDTPATRRSSATARRPGLDCASCNPPAERRPAKPPCRRTVSA